MISFPDAKTILILINCFLAIGGIAISACSAFTYATMSHAIRANYMLEAKPGPEALSDNDTRPADRRWEANALWAKKIGKEEWMVGENLSDYRHFMIGGLIGAAFFLINAGVLFTPVPWASQIFGIINGIGGIVVFPAVYMIRFGRV